VRRLDAALQPQPRRSSSHIGAITVPPTFDWDDIEDIAIGLTDAHPETDPLTVRFTDMHKWILELPNFVGEATKSNESKLEAIQMAWDEEYKDRQN
jgi:FeS assembly protein IscX